MFALAFALIAAGLYLLSCLVWPETNCGRCSGGGKNFGSTRRRFGACGKCGGSGRKPRLGTRLLFRER